MAYFVDKVVICDAYREPDKHYQLLSGGRSQLCQKRRPSMSFVATNAAVRGGIGGIVGNQATLFEGGAPDTEENVFVNELREEIKTWRQGGYAGTALVTRRLLEWWFEREEERKATGHRLFFCQQEAIEAVIYLYEVQNRRKLPETGDLLRYALKLATGTGKTVVMALAVVWSTLHKRKVSGSSLSANFLVLVPNLTVKDRVSGTSRGDGLDPAGTANLYSEFDMVPPEYQPEFQPNILVANWHSVPLESKREDWIDDNILEEGRFIPAAVLRATRVTHPPDGDARDIGIYKWRRQAHDTLENAIRNSASSGTTPVPILASPEWLDSLFLRRFQWTGIVADGKKSHTNKIACHTDLEKKFADFLDGAKDVIRYLKNERFGFSVTYYENSRPRQFFTDFIATVREVDGSETMWLAETKGEIRPNVPLKNAAAENWCQKMSATKYGRWRYLFAQQIPLETALNAGTKTFADLAARLGTK